MSDHGNILTYFESIFGEAIDHEVIKIILQSCDWDSNIAYQQLLSLSDTHVESDHENNSVSEPPLASSVVKQNMKIPSTTNFASQANATDELHSETPLSKLKFIKKLISEKKKILIVMRGLPGSGKSTLAHSLNTNGVVLSTDDYFIDRYKNYSFNSTILPEAHKWNKDRAKLKLYNGITPIFIDNTNLQLWEFEPYLRCALENGYYVDILEPDTYWKYNCKILSQKCIHNVSKKKIGEMKGRFETSLSVEDILKKLNLSNNLTGIDINTYRSVSRESDSEIVIEDDSSSENGSSCENESPKKILNVGAVRHDSYLETISKNENGKKNSEEKVDIIREIPKLSYDFECSLKKLNLQDSNSNKKCKEYSIIDLPESQNLGDENEWECLTSSASSCTWTNYTSVKNGSSESSISSKPQRFTKMNNSFSNANNSYVKKQIVDYYDVDDDDEDEDEDAKANVDWSPVEDFSLLEWTFKSETPKFSKDATKEEKSLDCNKGSSLHLEHTLKKSKDSQYCVEDFSSSEANIKTIESNPLKFIPSLMENSETNSQSLFNNEKYSEKSTMTEDSYVSKRKKLDSYPIQELKSFFPDIPEDDLEDFLEKCDYDIDWTVNILIDSGYKISSDLSREEGSKSSVIVIEDVPSCSSPVTQSSLQGNFIEESNSDFYNKGDSDKNNDTSHGTGTDEDDNSGKEEAQYLTMEIDNQFAAKLINMYGPVSSLNITSGFTKEDCRIVIPLEVCHDIYKWWAKTLEGKFKYEKDILDTFIREDEELARKLQEEENAVGDTSEVTVVSEPTSFKEIVNLQSLEEKNLRSKSSKESITYSTMLSLQKLQEEFVHIDPTAVEEEYFNQNLEYAATKTLLTYKYGPGKSTSDTVPGTTSESTESVEEWEDFSITVEDPQMYRDEAQIHYLERKKALQKAQEASQKGMKSVASYYAQIGNLHLQKFKEANDRASKKIVSALNTNRGPNSLDLHLLHVDEALREAQRFLSERKNVLSNMHLKEMQISIITGKGKHSQNGEARLKPAIKTFLTIERYQFTEYEGCFKVTLRSQSTQ